MFSSLESFFLKKESDIKKSDQREDCAQFLISWASSDRSDWEREEIVQVSDIGPLSPRGKHPISLEFAGVQQTKQKNRGAHGGPARFFNQQK